MTVERWGIFLSFFVFITLGVFANDEWRDVIKFGTETEVTALIQKLQADASYSGELDSEFVDLARNSKNQRILIGVLALFANKAKGGMEDKALSILEDRESETPEAVAAAIYYFEKVKTGNAVAALKGVIDEGPPELRRQSIRALGKTVDKGNADDIAAYLIDLYENRDPGAGNNDALVEALGETGSKDAVSFLTELVQGAEGGTSLRIAAIEALAKIGDGVDAIRDAAGSREPLVRAAALGALGAFSGAQVDEAVVEGLRDSFFRARVAAARSAGRRKLGAAVPYLKYRAEKDEALAVKEESIRALGVIGGADAVKALEELFRETKNPDRIRILAAEALLSNNPNAYIKEVEAARDEAQKKRQNGLYNGFLRALSAGKSSETK
jgi:HEAT repeat protein